MDRQHTWMRLLRGLALCVVLTALVNGCIPVPLTAPSCGPPAPRTVVIVIEENHGYAGIIGSPDAPYINRLATEGASFTQSFGVTHPSQPNYLAIFSGSTQGIADDQTHPHDLFTAPNLGSKLLAAGLTFAGYSEGLPEAGWEGDRAGDETAGFYYRKHNPWVNWHDATVPLPPNKLPPSVNQPLTSWPVNLDDLPTVAIVVPNQKHDMHDGSIAEADAWLEQNIGRYVEWAQTHNGLLILTWDEDDGREFNHIVTLFNGPMVQPRQYAGVINHYNVLRSVEDLFSLPHDGQTATAGPVGCDVWRPQ